MNKNDLIFYFFIVVGVFNIFIGLYYYGVEVFYSDGVVSVYLKYRECYGKLYNEDVICSFVEKYFFIKWYLIYFSILVGGFWKIRCFYL